MRLGVRNTGEKALPALTVTISIAGKEGQASSLPFGISDPQTGPRPARPPGLGPGRRATRGWPTPPTRAAPTTSNRKTFSFGPLKPGATTEAVWKLSAVKAGKLHRPLRDRRRPQRHRQGRDQRRRRRRLLRRPKISAVPPDTEVTDDGEVVEKAKQRQRSEPGE